MLSGTVTWNPGNEQNLFVGTRRPKGQPSQEQRQQELHKGH
jgi:hypothetical protein